MRFRLFDSVTGGNQFGAALTDVSVTAVEGVFSTKPDFGATALSGENRWLEIAVRQDSSELCVSLSPSEQLASAPLAVRTTSAATSDLAGNVINASLANHSLDLGGMPAVQFVHNRPAPFRRANMAIHRNSDWWVRWSTVGVFAVAWALLGEKTVRE